MTLPAITIVVEPPRVEVPIALVRAPRGDELARYRDLADAMQKHTAAPVSVVRTVLRDAPSGALVVRSSGYDAMMDEIPLEARAGYAARTVLLDVDRSVILAVLERHGFAGGVERYRWFQWRMERDLETGSGLLVRRDLIAAIGGRGGAFSPFSSDRYCPVGTDRFADLAGLIVGYLTACAQTWTALDGGAS